MQQYIPNKDKALRMAQNGEFDMVYTTSKRDCQAEKEQAQQNEDLDDESKGGGGLVQGVKNAALAYLKQLNGFDAKIGDAIKPVCKNRIVPTRDNPPARCVVANSAPHTIKT